MNVADDGGRAGTGDGGYVFAIRKDVLRRDPTGHVVELGGVIGSCA